MGWLQELLHPECHTGAKKENEGKEEAEGVRRRRIVIKVTIRNTVRVQQRVPAEVGDHRQRGVPLERRQRRF